MCKRWKKRKFMEEKSPQDAIETHYLGTNKGLESLVIKSWKGSA